jgi:hypothetical protein
MTKVHPGLLKKCLSAVIFLSVFGVIKAEVNYGLFKQIDTARVIESFPYTKFLKNVAPENVSEIRNYKRVMDSLKLPSGQILFAALTTHLKEKEKEKSSGFDIEYLLGKLTLGARYTDVGDFYIEDPILYKAIGSSWFDYVGDKLADTIKSAPQLRNNPVIAGMLNRLVEYKANPESVPASNMTKVLYNLSAGKWSYLLDRLQVASTTLKIALLLLFIVLFVEQIIVIQSIYRFFKNRAK